MLVHSQHGIYYCQEQKNEVMRIHLLNGTNTFVGINNSTQSGTLDVVNISLSANILAIRNTSSSLMCSLLNTGLSALAQTGSTGVLYIGGTMYTATTVQAAFVLSSKTVFKYSLQYNTEQSCTYNNGESCLVHKI